MSNVIDFTKPLNAAFARHLGLLFSREFDATSLSREESIKAELEVYAGGNDVGQVGLALFFGETSIGFAIEATTARALADALWEGADHADSE